MRSFITLFAFAAAATAATSPLVAREDASTCAMKTLLSSSACNTGDAACLCSDAARKFVMQEIESSCGAEASEATEKLATEACSTQKMRRATAPSGTSSAASASSSAAERTNGAQDSSDGEGCTCANTGSSKNSANTPAEQVDETDAADPNTDTPTNASPISHGSNNENEPAQSSRAHAANANAMATAAAASSSAVRHGALATPTHSPGALPTPSGAAPFQKFQGAGVQVLPSLSVVLAALGAFVAL